MWVGQIKGTQEKLKSGREDVRTEAVVREGRRCPVAGSGDGGRGPEANNAGSRLEDEKGKETEYLLKISRRAQPEFSSVTRP